MRPETSYYLGPDVPARDYLASLGRISAFVDSYIPDPLSGPKDFLQFIIPTLGRDLATIIRSAGTIDRLNTAVCGLEGYQNTLIIPPRLYLTLSASSELVTVASSPTGKFTPLKYPHSGFILYLPTPNSSSWQYLGSYFDRYSKKTIVRQLSPACPPPQQDLLRMIPEIRSAVRLIANHFESEKLVRLPQWADALIELPSGN